jgi:hypothetical protein
MNAAEIILAMTLLTSPPGTPEPNFQDDDWPGLQASMQSLAIEWEILDPREVRYVLTRKDDFEADLNLLRKRYQELKDVPRIADGQRFPDRANVNELLTYNRTLRKHFETRQLIETDRASDFRQAIHETDRLYQVWDSVRDARCEFYYITVRRQALKKLRDLVGPESYYNGTLPPHVPLWRLPEF